MALVGLVRVSTKKQDVARQHDALDPICVKVFEEKVSGKLAVDHRPGLRAALDYLRDDDMLTVQEVDRLGRNLLEGLIVLTELFERGTAVKVLEGIAAGEHTERSLILDLALALAEDRRRDIVRKTRNGLEAARRRGNVGGRPRVIDEDRRTVILARREKGESIREIARATGVSTGTVWSVLNDEASKGLGDEEGKQA
ncbi:Site-specific DNA recombinase [Brevibacterium sp. Mu109]|uniref:recombinase family protein n=1 Tax=Brevibacterium sp. Mu109 TaxID=1255669 RepID=UPI000C6AD55D|nr:recombinase family protein [Brevibacterium sp. Mu109]SMX68061.1 Site-specific DNA recombinase [Brevibacterium sp. Mu109]